MSRKSFTDEQFAKNFREMFGSTTDFAQELDDEMYELLMTHTDESDEPESSEVVIDNNYKFAKLVKKNKEVNHG